MTQHIRDRINRNLDALSEERLYQVLDYVEFLESRYGQRAATPPNAFQRLADGIEDRLRAGGIAASTVSEAMGFLNKAMGALNGVAAAGRSVATDLAAAAQRAGTAVSDAVNVPPGAPGAPGTAAPSGAGQPPAGATPTSGAPTPPPSASPGPSADAFGTPRAPDGGPNGAGTPPTP